MNKIVRVFRDTLGKPFWVLLLLGLTWLSLGCGTSAEPAVVSNALPDAGRGNPSVGTQVGNHIPRFTMKLVDGTQVTSAELLQEGQPTFLISFSTW